MVKFRSKAIFGEATMNTLAKHFSILESVDMDGCETVTSDHLVRVLSSCTRLHTLLCSHWRYESNQSPINAKVFVDVDDTGSLKSWQCETSLKVLRTQITGIPRPDLTGGIVAEVYPGQARELHGQIYDRLARLTNLERLQLGTISFKPHSDCLEMSLESGLIGFISLRVWGPEKIPIGEITWISFRNVHEVVKVNFTGWSCTTFFPSPLSFLILAPS